MDKNIKNSNKLVKYVPMPQNIKGIQDICNEYLQELKNTNPLNINQSDKCFYVAHVMYLSSNSDEIILGGGYVEITYTAI